MKFRVALALSALLLSPGLSAAERNSWWDGSKAVQEFQQALTELGYFGVPRYTTALLPPCTAVTNRGALAYDTTAGVLKVCDGAAWASAGGLSSPVAGDFVAQGKWTWGSAADAANSVRLGEVAGQIIFEGATADGIETILAVTDPLLVDKTITLPNATGTVVTTGNLTDVTAINITGTSCTNQFVSAISAGGAGTCTTATLAGAQFANQGTTTTVLHGNAGGNPSFGAVVDGDLSGAVGFAHGGTGQTTATEDSVLVGAGLGGWEMKALTDCPAGGVSYATATNTFGCTAIPAAGANVALSNLAGVAINTSLLSDTAATDDLGSAAVPWKGLYLRGGPVSMTSTGAGNVAYFTVPTLALTGAGNTVIGSGAGALIATGTGNVAIGDTAGDAINLSGSSNTVVGYAAGSNVNSATGALNSGFGYGACQHVTTGASNVCVGAGTGQYSSSNKNRQTLLGTYAGGTGNDSIGLGYYALTTADNQFVVGGWDGGTLGVITQVYIGEGVTKTAAPTGVTINATGGSGTDIAGGSLTIAGGKGTGSSNAGSIVFQTSDELGTGTTLQTLATRVTIDGSDDTVMTITNSNNPQSNLVLVDNTKTVTTFGDGGGVTFTSTSGTPQTYFAVPANSTITGADNLILGTGAGAALTSGTGNVLIGTGAGDAATTVNGNVLIGASTGTGSNIGYANTCVGSYACQSTNVNTAQYNVGVGYSALNAMNQGQNNTAIGYTAGGDITTGTNNTIIGYGAAAGAVAATYRIALGSNATAGTNNTMVVGADGAEINTIYFGVGQADAAAESDFDSVTLQASGVGTSTSDQAGANMILASGLGEGDADVSDLHLKTPEKAADGSNPQALVDRSIIVGTSVTQTEGTPATLFSVTVPVSSACGVTFEWTAWSVTASEIAIASGRGSFSGWEDPDAAAQNCAVSASTGDTAVVSASAGTYAPAWSCDATDTTMEVKVDVAWDQAAPASSTVKYSLTHSSGCVITLP